MKKIQITKHFDLSEFTHSKTAIENKINNTPEAIDIKYIKELAKNVLEPIREHFNAPLIITSGFRCQKLNMLIGGARQSQHILGQACDFYVKGVNNQEVCDWIIKNIEFDQLILEPNWIHISFRKQNREEYWIV